MSATWATIGEWLLRSAVGGGLLLALAWQLMKWCRQPARRQRLGEWGVFAALLVSCLSLGPHWFVVPLLGTEIAPTVQTARRSPPSPAFGDHPDSAQRVVDSGDDGADLGTFFSGEAPLWSPAESAAVADGSSPSTGAVPQHPDESLWPSLRNRAAVILESLPLAAVGGWFGIAYVILAALLFCRWLLGHITLSRLLGKARPAPEPVRRLFEAMARFQRRTPRLLVSKRLRVPVSCGLWHPTVIVPSSLCRPVAARRLQWVFAHELTHLERRDAWSCLLFGLAQVLYFYLPWFWGVRRQVRLCQEYVADAAAAGQTGDAEDYAQFLLTLTTSPAVPLGATGVLGNSSDLFRRVNMLLQNPARVEKQCPRWWSLVTAAGLLGVAVFTSGISLRADAATPSPDEERIVVVLDESDSIKSDDKKEAPEKKKDSKKEWTFKFEFPDIDEMLKNLPSNLDPEQVKQFHEQMMKAREQVRQAMEQVKKQVDVRKELEKAWAQVPFREGEFAFGGRRNRFERSGGGRLGVRVAPPSDTLVDQLDLHKGNGLVIDEVVAGSVADKAGLKAHDVLLEFNGKMVSNDPGSFAKLVHDLKPDTTVDAVVLRKGKKETIKGISLPEEKAPQPVAPQARPLPLKRVTPVPQVILRERGKPDGKEGHRVIVTSNRTDNEFTSRRQEDGLSITVSGTVAEGKAKVSEIQVKDGDKSKKYDSVDQVPEEYRDKVKELVEMGGTGRIKVETKSESKSEKGSRSGSKKESKASSPKNIINE